MLNKAVFTLEDCSKPMLAMLYLSNEHIVICHYISTDEGIRYPYIIYSGNWLSGGIDLAQGIEDFIYEYDTYEAKDLYNSREEMVEAIQN